MLEAVYIFGCIVSFLFILTRLSAKDGVLMNVTFLMIGVSAWPYFAIAFAIMFLNGKK
jgi:hypothetical protein